MQNEKILAFHVDLKRAMWRCDYIDRYLGRLAAWGYNAVVLELEDKFRFSSHPDIVHPDAPTHDEYSKLTKLCRDKGMDVIPLMQSLGHLENVVSRENYAHLREAPDLRTHVDPTNPASRKLVIELFEEIIDVFQPAAFFHMGGDETWELGKSDRLSTVVEKYGKGRLYIDHMLPIMHYLLEHNLRPMIWADMLLTHPEVIADVPKNVVMVDWDYDVSGKRRKQVLVWGGAGQGGNISINYDKLQTWDNPEKKAFLEKHAMDSQTFLDHTFPAFWCTDYLMAQGFNVVTAPATRSYGDTMGAPRIDPHLPNCHYFAGKGLRDGVGTIVTSWAVRCNHPEVNLCGAFAAAMLSGEGAFDLTKFCAGYTCEVFGQEYPEFSDAITKAQVVTPLSRGETVLHLLTSLRAGKLEMAALRADVASKYQNESDARTALQDAIRGYGEALAVFEHMRGSVERNSRHLDFWIEGVLANRFFAKVAFSLVDDSLEKDAPRLFKECESARKNTELLFMETFPQKSAVEEANVRYCFFEKLLANVGNLP